MVIEQLYLIDADFLINTFYHESKDHKLAYEKFSEGKILTSQVVLLEFMRTLVFKKNLSSSDVKLIYRYLTRDEKLSIENVKLNNILTDSFTIFDDLKSNDFYVDTGEFTLLLLYHRMNARYVCYLVSDDSDVSQLYRMYNVINENESNEEET